MESLPRHVAIIMDGNGRWAKRRGLPRIFGHREGVKAVKRIVSHAAKCGIKHLSLFAFSTENWLRPAEEINALMKILSEFIDKELNNIINENIKLTVSGRTDMLPANVVAKLDNALHLSDSNTGLNLNLCLSYGGRHEIIDAAVKFARDYSNNKLQLEDADKIFENYLYNPDIPDVDLLIRTSGEKRISNFMLWRLAYAELYFTQTLWPGFFEDEFDLALEEYAARIRRFGKTDEQIHK